MSVTVLWNIQPKATEKVFCECLPCDWLVVAGSWRVKVKSEEVSLLVVYRCLPSSPLCALLTPKNAARKPNFPFPRHRAGTGAKSYSPWYNCNNVTLNYTGLEVNLQLETQSNLFMAGMILVLGLRCLETSGATATIEWRLGNVM